MYEPNEQYKRMQLKLVKSIKTSKRQCWNELLQKVDGDVWGRPYKLAMKALKSQAITNLSSASEEDSWNALPSTAQLQNPIGGEGWRDYSSSRNRRTEIGMRKSGKHQMPWARRNPQHSLESRHRSEAGYILEHVHQMPAGGSVSRQMEAAEVGSST